MHAPLNCLRCRTIMEEGYVRDRGHHEGVEPATWVEGVPEKRWYGIKTKGHDMVPITAWRCPACGYLELRALEGS